MWVKNYPNDFPIDKLYGYCTANIEALENDVFEYVVLMDKLRAFELKRFLEKIQESSSNNLLRENVGNVFWEYFSSWQLMGDKINVQTLTLEELNKYLFGAFNPNSRVATITFKDWHDTSVLTKKELYTFIDRIGKAIKDLEVIVNNDNGGFMHGSIKYFWLPAGYLP